MVPLIGKATETSPSVWLDPSSKGPMYDVKDVLTGLFAVPPPMS